MTIDKTLANFLKRHSDPSKPLVLALSGGADSLCLFYTLLKHPQYYSALHIAHVDHNWRGESFAEAQKLQMLASHFNCPFHLQTLCPDTLKGNLEEACRNQRIAFFIECVNQLKAQAVVLGHHADDQAETILKRILEGAPLVRLGGMGEIVQFSGVPFWRPWINLPKKKMEGWLEKEGICWFDDKTNRDLRFLRSRMRHSLIPDLTRQFGKEVAKPLCRLSQEAQEVQDYLEKRVSPYLDQVISGPFGLCLDFSSSHPIELLEWKVLVRLICEKEGIVLPREAQTLLAELLKSKQGNKQVVSGDFRLWVDRGRVFILKTALGKWELSQVPFKKGQRASWKDIFQGNAEVSLPQGNYTLDKPCKGEFCQLWSKQKIPFCIRELAPILREGEHSRHELLTGKIGEFGKESLSLRIKFIQF